jgi:outer membrane protein TolC
MNTGFTGKTRLLRTASYGAVLAMTGLSALILLASPNVNSFGEEIVELSLSDCLARGLANNLDIKIAKIEPRIKGEDVRLARAVFDTTIEGSASYEDDQRARSSTIFGTQSIETDYELGISTKMSTGTELDIDYSDTREWTDSAFAVNNPLHTAELSFTLTQPVLKNFFGYVDRAGVKISKLEAEAADIEALDRIEDTVADIEKAYWKLVFEYQNAALKKELFEQAEKLYAIFEGHLKTGLTESTEVYGAEANMRIKKAELTIAENGLKSAGNNLKLLLNEGGDFLIAPKDRLKALGGKIDRAESLNEALRASRVYKTKKKNLEAKKVKVKMKENSLWPEVDLVGTFAVNGVDKKFSRANRRLTIDKHPMYYGGIEVKVPLENRTSRGEYEKASLEKEKAILELLKAEKDLITEVDEEVRDVNLSLENAKRWTEIRKIQYKKFKDEEKKIKYGRSSAKAIIDYQNDLMLAILSEYNAVLDYYLALIELENAKDSLLSKVGVL